ncbi:MAG: transglutaminase domain-containing protein, partial [Muribaculaceae bacterium]|nr:transglutaminase domain-containing protein [Muribaculaceae bacterium]
MKKVLIILCLAMAVNGWCRAATVEELRNPDMTGLMASEQEKEALRFLYQYMPLADVTDYPLEFHLENVRATFEARGQMPWGNTVPELLFMHFVLPLRVNNEALDMSRPVFFKELKERVAGMSMEEAILEVNHWCHEHVTYQPSDART